MPEVLPVGEAREALSKCLAAFRLHGRDAAPVFFGARRQAEAVIIPVSLFAELVELSEDILIAHEVRERLARDGGQRFTHAEVLSELGLDPAEFD